MNKNENKLKYLISFSGNYRIFTFVGLILEVLSAVCLLVPYVYIWKFLDEIFRVYPHISQANNLELYAVYAVLYAVLGIFLNFTALMCTHYSAFHNEENMKKACVEHLTKVPLGYFNSHSSGELRKIIDMNSSQTESFLAHMLPNLVGAMVTPVVFLVLLFSFNWQLGLICIIPVIVAFLMFIPMFSGDNVSFMVKYQDCLEEMNAQAVEYLRGIPVTKTFQQSVYSFKRFHKSIVDYGHFAREYSLSTQLPMTVFTVSVNGFYILLIPAGILLAGSLVNSSFLVDFIFYIIFTPVCGSMINKIMIVSESWALASQSLDRIDGILSIEELPQASETVQLDNYNIRFDNVTFDYDKENRNKHILDHVNLEVNEGEIIALVGPSGSGKTTIANLIPRFYDVDSGSVSIGGVDVRDMDEKTLMHSISYVFQDSYLFNDTIYNNVRMASTSAAEEDVLEALSQAQCKDIIEKLPEGADTVIGSDGTYLSGGERQRIALARAILKDAPVIILDEATALADPENELQIQKALNRITYNKTVIMIAHRLSTIQNVDRIYVIADGKVCEAGNHETLLEKDGIYAKMWREYNKSVNWKVDNRGDDCD